MQTEIPIIHNCVHIFFAKILSGKKTLSAMRDKIDLDAKLCFLTGEKHKCFLACQDEPTFIGPRILWSTWTSWSLLGVILKTWSLQEKQRFLQVSSYNWDRSARKGFLWQWRSRQHGLDHEVAGNAVCFCADWRWHLITADVWRWNGWFSLLKVASTMLQMTGSHPREAVCKTSLQDYMSLFAAAGCTWEHQLCHLSAH